MARVANPSGCSGAPSLFPADTHKFSRFYTVFRKAPPKLVLLSELNPPYDRVSSLGDVELKTPMRETVRSGRRENFYVTDNSFIDHYARQMQPVDIAVYHALERYANCHTRSTYVGTAKIAEVLNVSQRTVQRSLKTLEDLKLIRIVQTSTVKMYFIVPVPPRPKTAAIPLFEGIKEEEFSLENDMCGVWTTPESRLVTSMSRIPSSVTRATTAASRSRDTDDGLYKEEQDLLNKTIDQDFFKKTDEEEKGEITESAQRILTILRLSDSHMNAATAAVEERRKQTRLSKDGIVQDIVTAANHAVRRGIEKQEFLEDFLAEQLARRTLKNLDLPMTNNLISAVAAAIKAEVTYTRSSMEKVAAFITSAALGHRRTGMTIDRFYFENVKWRGNGRTGKGQQQFERIKRARDEAHAIIDAQMDH